MKAFEQKWTAWLDGELCGKELAEFEASLSDKAAAEADKREVKKLSALLKQHLSADVLTNEEFFSHQLRERIRCEDEAKDRHGARSTWWSIRRLALSGATALAIFAIYAVVVMRETASRPDGATLDIDEVHLLAFNGEGQLTDLWDLPSDPEAHDNFFDGK